MISPKSRQSKQRGGRLKELQGIGLHILSTRKNLILKGLWSESGKIIPSQEEGKPPSFWVTFEDSFDTNGIESRWSSVAGYLLPKAESPKIGVHRWFPSISLD